VITDGIQSAGTIMIIVGPILTPALIPIGVDPVHFAIVFTHNMEIALVHPPVGPNLYVLATISRAPVLEVVRATSPSWFCCCSSWRSSPMFQSFRSGCPRYVYG